jgi:hypothetical protein
MDELLQSRIQGNHRIGAQYETPRMRRSPVDPKPICGNRMPA